MTQLSSPQATPSAVPVFPYSMRTGPVYALSVSDVGNDVLVSAIRAARHYTEPTTVRPDAEFARLAAQWRKSCAVMSAVDDIVGHPAYLHIISLGLPAVPLILAELQQQPDYWFAALRSITGANPVKEADRGKMKRMARAWITWGKKNGYIR